MAGSLVLIDSDTASTSGSITLTGMTSAYDVYMVTVNNVFPVNDNVYLHARFTESGGSGTSQDPYIEYTLGGYANNINGVLAVKIGEVNNLATADIDKIIGV